MGRSRAAAKDDPTQRRKRVAENVESEGSIAGVSGITGLKKALYHCNYCNKDISGNIRIKCVVCFDFDLCIECFSVGAEVNPHQSNHPYRVMDNLAFPFICPDWNVDEEMLLLEGIEMYGLGNWNEVAEHVGTKIRSQCMYHYEKIYMNSPCFPLPDMSQLMGKSREELLAMVIGESETEKGGVASHDFGTKVEASYPPKIETEDGKNVAGRSSSSISSGCSADKISFGMNRRISDDGPRNDVIDDIKLEDRTIGEKKPRSSGEESVSLKELSGYNFKREEFELEYDNDAEQLLADMEFKDTDSKAEHEVKLRVLQIYSKRLDERKRRKTFILERNLLYPDLFERGLTAEEQEACHQYRVFMRFHSIEEHRNLMSSLVEHLRIVKRIQYLQEARAAGCRTSAEASRYIDQKAKAEVGENVKGINEHSLATSNLQNGGQQENWCVAGFPGADLLSDAEKQLCGEMRILPTHYLDMLETLSVGILNGNITKKADAHVLIHVDPDKVDLIYDTLIRKGVVQE